LAILERAQPVQVLDLFSKVSFTLSAGEQGAHNAAFALWGLLTVNRDGTARLWDTKKRIELRRLTHRRPIREAHLLPGRGWGGAQVLTISDVGEVRLWGRPKESVVDATGDRRVMKWSLSGDYILSADNFASRIDARTGEEVQIQLNFKSDHSCVAGALSPDGRHAVFATKSLPPQTLRLVDLSGENEQINLPLERHVEVKDLAVALGGSPVLATTQLGAVLVWTPEATSEEERLRVFYSAETESKAIRKTSIVLLDPDGSSFLRVVGGDNTTLIRRSNSGKILGELKLRTRWNLRRARPSWQRSNSGVYLSLAAEDGQYFLVETRALVSTKITPPEKAQLLQVDNDGRLLLRSKESFLVVNKSGDVLYRIPDS
jgi:WD40 repeat protein